MKQAVGQDDGRVPGSTGVPRLSCRTLSWRQAQGGSDSLPAAKELELEQGLWGDSRTSSEPQRGRRKEMLRGGLSWVLQEKRGEAMPRGEECGALTVGSN